MKDLNDFDEIWDPYTINSLEGFKNQVMTSGNEYWGDYLMIQLITQVFQINLFILTQNDLTDVYEPYPLAMHYNYDYPTIVLIHENESHFKLLGHFQGIMITYFVNESLPIEIRKLFNLK